MKTPRELFPDQETACWGIDEPLSDLRFVKANAIQQAKGLIGWVYGTHAGHSLDGLRVLRADDGRYVAEFSSRGVVATGSGATELTDHDLEGQVLGELRRRGLLP